MPRPESDAPWALAVAVPAVLGESPMWHPAEQCLYYCDIAGHEVRRFDPATGECLRWQFDTEVASLAPMADGALLLAQRDGLWRFDCGTGLREPLAAPPYDPAQFRFNDGKCDAAGRFWVGTLNAPRQPLSALYRFDRQRGLQQMADGITVSNGLGFSPDGRTMYYCDSATREIRCCDYDPGDSGSAAVANPRVFAAADAAPGDPDGSTIDAEGYLWNARWGGGQVVRFAPDGRVDCVLALPAPQPTCAAFGGPGLDVLYVSSATVGLAPAALAAATGSGGVFAQALDVCGLPEQRFGCLGVDIQNDIDKR